MPPEGRDAAPLWDMARYARAAADVVAGRTFEEYGRDLTLQLALERALEIVGEAARKVSREFRQAHPEIPWEAIVGQRHVLAHDYGRIKQDRIWRVATAEIPDLLAKLERIAPPPPEEEEP